MLQVWDFLNTQHKTPNTEEMPATIALKKDLIIGEKSVFEAKSPSQTFVVAFEDDGETGYFYACDSALETFIADALHIYNVAEVADKSQIYEISMMWSSDGQKAGLFINRRPQALFDFGAHRGYCRSNFPAPSPEWAVFHADHSWDERAFDLLV